MVTGLIDVENPSPGKTIKLFSKSRVFLQFRMFRRSIPIFVLFLKRPAAPAQNDRQHMVAKKMLTHKTALAIDDDRKSEFFINKLKGVSISLTL